MNYIDYAIHQSAALQGLLVQRNQESPAFDFYKKRETYEKLDREEYKSAEPAFVFCGLMHDAISCAIRKGETVTEGSYHCLQLSIAGVSGLVTDIQTFRAMQRTGDWTHLQSEFQILEEDFKNTQERRRRENVNLQFRLKMELQLYYLERTLAALLGAGGCPRVEDRVVTELLLAKM